MYISKYACYFDIDDRHGLIISSLTGAVDLLDSNGKDAWFTLAQDSGKRIDKAFMSRLQERGYVFPSQRDETQLFMALENSFHSANNNGTRRLAMCPTYQCNLACKYCYERELPQTSGAVLTEGNIQHLFQIIDHSYNQAGKHISIELTGGEPLLPKNEAIIERVLFESAGRGHSIGIVTNGVCLASHFTELLLQYSKHISFVQVTLDGPPHIHNARRVFANGGGTFEHIVTSIDFLVAHRFPVRLRTNVDSQNVSHLSQLAEIVTTRGWITDGCLQCDLAPVLDHRGSSKYPYIISEAALVKDILYLREHDSRVGSIFRCHIFRILQHVFSIVEGARGFPSPCFQYCEANSPDFCVFGADGLIYACGEAIGNPELAIGQFLPDYEVWPEREQLWRGRSIASIPACRECSIAGFCGGGCTFSAITQHGSPNVGICNGADEVLESYCRTLAQADMVSR